MSMLHTLLSRIFPDRCEAAVDDHDDVNARLDAVSKDIGVATEAAMRSSEAVIRSTEEDQITADRLVDQGRDRLALLEARRTQRVQDPRIRVVMEAVRIMEQRE